MGKIIRIFKSSRDKISSWECFVFGIKSEGNNISSNKGYEKICRKFLCRVNITYHRYKLHMLRPGLLMLSQISFFFETNQKVNSGAKKSYDKTILKRKS